MTVIAFFRLGKRILCDGRPGGYLVSALGGAGPRLAAAAAAHQRRGAGHDCHIARRED